MWTISRLAVLCLLAWASAAAAREVPLFPGAAQDAAATARYLEEERSALAEEARRGRAAESDEEEEYDSDRGADRRLRELAHAGSRFSGVVYVTPAAPDDVVRFFKQKLGVRGESTTSVDPETLEPGTASAPQMSVYMHGEDDFVDQWERDTLIYRGSVLKKAVEKDRTPYRKGEWVAEAHFNWAERATDGEVSGVSIHIRDDSVQRARDSDGNQIADVKVVPRTMITVGRWTTPAREKLEAQVQTEIADERKREYEQARAHAVAAPSDADLGVARYPGATFDGAATALASPPEDAARRYVFVSKDAPAAIAKFYESTLRKPPDIRDDSRDDEMFVFAMRGKMPAVEEGLLIKRNDFIPGGATSVIIVWRASKGEPGR